MSTVLEWTIWICVGLAAGWGLGVLHDKCPYLFRRAFPNFWDCVIFAFFLYGMSWILPHAGDHITRLSFLVLVDAWYVWARVREVRKARDAS